MQGELIREKVIEQDLYDMIIISCKQMTWVLFDLRLNFILHTNFWSSFNGYYCSVQN